MDFRFIRYHKSDTYCKRRLLITPPPPRSRRKIRSSAVVSSHPIIFSTTRRKGCVLVVVLVLVVDVAVDDIDTISSTILYALVYPIHITMARPTSNNRKKLRIRAFLGGLVVTHLVVAYQIWSSPYYWNNNTKAAAAASTTETISHKLPSLLACNHSSSSSSSSSLDPARPRLQFVHIRKTGGSAIERSLDLAGIRGYQDYYKRGAAAGGGGAGAGRLIDEKALKRLTNRTVGNAKHVPPRYFISLKNKNSNNNDDDDDDTKFFAVVRSPYERAVSEYYQHFKFGGAGRPSSLLDRNNISSSQMNDPGFMNAFIQARFGHPDLDLFIPQYEYIFDMDETTRIVDHILHFERLQSDFQRLMDCYYGPDKKKEKTKKKKQIRLVQQRMNPRQKGALLTGKDLSTESLRLINQIEARSFVEFGYSMRTTT